MKQAEILYEKTGLIYTENPKIMEAMTEFAKVYHKEQLRLHIVSGSLQPKSNLEILKAIQSSKRYALPNEWKLREHTNTNYMGGFLNGVKWREGNDR